MEADTGSDNSGANSGTASDSGSWLDNALDSAGDFLHDHGPYALMSPGQQQTALDAVGWMIDGNRAASAPAALSTTQKPDSAQLASTDAPALSAPAPKPAPSNEQLGYASLVCGYTAKDAPRQLDDFGLAQHFGVSPRIIAARPDDFYRRWVIKSTRELLPSAPSACRAILNDPHNAAQITPHLPSLAAVNAAMNGALPPGAPGGNQDASYLTELRSRASNVLDGLYDAVGNTAHTIRNEVVGELHATARAGTFLPAEAASALGWATGSDKYEKWVLKKGVQAEDFLPNENQDYRPVISNGFYAATSGVGNGLVYGTRGATVLTGALPAVYDWAATKLFGKNHDEAGNWWFSHTTDKLQARQERLALDPKASSVEKVLHAAGSMIGMAPYVLPTRGAGMPGLMGQAVHNATLVAPLAAINSVNAGNDTYVQTGDSDAAWKVAGVSAMTTELSGVTLMSLFGSRWFAAANAQARVATVTGTTLATGEGSRLANNASSPPGMQQGFSPENTIASLLTMMPAAHMRASTHDALNGKEPATSNPPDSTEPQLVHPVSDAAAPPDAQPQIGQGHVEQARAGLLRATHAFDAVQFASQLDRIARAARADTLSKADPALQKNLVREMDAETGSPAVYARKNEVLRALQQAGIEPEAFRAALPELYAQLQSQPVDGMVRFTRADLALYPELLESVIPVARASKDTPNAIEATATAQDHIEHVRQKFQKKAGQIERQGAEPKANGTEGEADSASINGRADTADTKILSEYQRHLQRIAKLAENIKVSEADHKLYQQLYEAIGNGSTFSVKKSDLAQALQDAPIPLDVLGERLPGLFRAFIQSAPDKELTLSHELIAQHPEVLKYVIPYARPNGRAAENTARVLNKPATFPENTPNEADTSPFGEAQEAMPVEERPPVSGFDNNVHYRQFVETLQSGLALAGYPDAVPIMQGSSVTGQSFKTELPFGPHSDLDVAIASPTLFAKARALGLDTKQEVRAGPVKSKKLLNKLGLWELKVSLSDMVNHDVEFMLYMNEISAWRRGPSVHIK